MTRYALFLRGVNVGGVNLKMGDVATALRDAGFAQVRTVLASGNAVVDAEDAGVGAIRARAETALREAFGYEAWVLAYELDEVRAIVEEFPFQPELDGYQSYVTFVSHDSALDELSALAADAGPEEKIVRGHGVLYWQVPKSTTLDSTIGKTMGQKRYRSSTTTRNLRTLAKVVR